MNIIPLTQDKAAIVDDADFEFLSSFKWHAKRGRNTWYAQTMTPYGRVLMHQLVMLGARQIDHKDLDGLNNRWENLRPATSVQNQGNSRMHKNNTSGFKGVSREFRSCKWYARIQPSGSSIFLGYADSAAEAAKLYDKAAVAYFGEFARINFPLC